MVSSLLSPHHRLGSSGICAAHCIAGGSKEALAAIYALRQRSTITGQLDVAWPCPLSPCTSFICASGLLYLSLSLSLSLSLTFLLSAFITAGRCQEVLSKYLLIRHACKSSLPARILCTVSLSTSSSKAAWSDWLHCSTVPAPHTVLFSLRRHWCASLQ